REDWTTGLDAGRLGKDEVEEVRRTAYEALIWLSDDMLRREEDHASGQRLSPESAARQALSYLAKAETAHRPTRALYDLRAKCRTIAGEKEAAQADSRLADQTAPTMALDDYLLGQAALQARDTAAAIQAFEAALRREPTHYWSLMRLGGCLCQFGQGPEDFAMAAGIFSGCILKRPDHAHAYCCRGMAYWRLDRYQEAVADCSKAIELDPKDANAWYNRAAGYYRMGQLDKAVADCSQAIALDPKDAAAWINRGAAYADLGQLNKAVADSSQAIELEPKYANAWSNRGVAYLRLGQPDKTVADCSKAIALDPKDAHAWSNRGHAYVNLGQLDKAVADCSKAIELDPKDADAWGNRGAAYADLGQLDEAVADLSKAIELEPKEATGWYDRGVAYVNLGQLDKAVADCSKAIELEPKFAAAWFERGNAYGKLGQLDEAIADCSKAIELDPKDAKAWSNRGVDYLNLGQLDKAVADCSKAIALNPDLAEAHCNLGLALQGQGAFQAALTELRRGHELGSKNPRLASPSAQCVRQCERLIELDGQLPGFLEGKTTPASADERIELAQLCSLKRLNRAALRFYEEAFAGPPDSAARLLASNRYNAACAAALAGCGRGDDAKDLDDKERARWRRQALDWLRADLAVQEGQVNSIFPWVSKKGLAALRHWQADAALSGLRDAPELAKLPPDEQEACKQLWADVQALLDKAEPKK
ncbi:MAG TPA: tetratricopeptide repeat protein, partial [Gemmataceae bacterium]|nr:tetratricopeptide repeat protein [Gemmataceae bacterium]